MLLIRSKSERGFWRAGLFFPRAGVQIDPDTLSAAQRAAIEAEPNLVVTKADADAESADAPAKPAGKKAKQAA